MTLDLTATDQVGRRSRNENAGEQASERGSGRCGAGARSLDGECARRHLLREVKQVAAAQRSRPG